MKIRRSSFGFFCYLLKIKTVRYIMAYMTQEGYDKMVARLHHMEAVERPAASAAIAEARD